MGLCSGKAGAGSLRNGGPPPNYRGRVCGWPLSHANLGKWEPGLDRLDDLIPEDLFRAPACPQSGFRVLRLFLVLSVP